MCKIHTNKNKRIERRGSEFHTTVQDVPTYNPFGQEVRETWEQSANQCRNFEADLAAGGVVP
ncbi:MAG: hypothetical protein FIB07_07860 [Candidatus Methanoperedens sp.]|nr:hypothetical protein [Candidatus Methanoperedens sp.]